MSSENVEKSEPVTVITESQVDKVIDNELAKCFKCKASREFVIVSRTIAFNGKNVLKIGECVQCKGRVSRISKEVVVDEKALYDTFLEKRQKKEAKRLVEEEIEEVKRIEKEKSEKKEKKSKKQKVKE